MYLNSFNSRLLAKLPQTRSPTHKGSTVQEAVRRTAHRLLICDAGVATAPAPAIGLSDKALTHLQKLRSQSGSDQLLLRIGVKSGGCSGMSYLMDFEQESNVKPEDSIIDYEGQFRLVCDSKSLLYLFGMQLDYSDALIGGGFQFHNPNAQDTCGCGKSFGV